MATGGDPPIEVEEIAVCLDRATAHGKHFLVAVSGGADSICLMHLTARWAARRGNVRVSVATVDHRLRPGSATEARSVARDAAELGLPHATLAWEGPRPETGIQSAARDARRRLLLRHATAIGAQVLLLAHTRNDQAETLLMRLARGSGVDGLAAMRATTTLGGLAIVRPLLAMDRSRIEATLRASGVAWLTDPSNDCIDFERTRLRRTAPVLAGLGLTQPQIARSARRLGRASEALEALATGLLEPGAGCVAFHPFGFARIDWQSVLRQPAELRLRLLASIVSAVGGAPPPLSLARLEALTEGRNWQLPAGRTFARVAFSRSHTGALMVLREHRRHHPAPALLQAGSATPFDGRFVVRLNRPIACATLRWLGEAGDRYWGRDIGRPDGIPAAALATLPVLWIGERPCAVPHLGYYDGGVTPEDMSVTFPASPAGLGS